MDLSPEERRKIYEEEKERIEAEAKSAKERKSGASETSTGLDANVESLLCYLGGWVTGIIFLIIEQKNRLVRFHAAQSLILFGLLMVIGSLMSIVPIIGDAFSAIVGIIGFVFWLILIIKTATGEVLRLGWISEAAEKIVGTAGISEKPVQPAAAPQESTVHEAAAPVAAVVAARPPVNLEKEIERKVEEFFNRKKAGRIASSVVSIAFSLAALIFFNYFNDYVAYYWSERIGGATVWYRTPFFTEDIGLWLPVLTTALVVTIVAHVLVIIYDRYIFRELMMIITDCFSLASAIVLVSVYPFDFNVIPGTAVAGWVDISVFITLMIVCFGIGIGILVKGIKLLINILKGSANYQSA